MLRELVVHGYRCFGDFRMTGISQVNLLVGKNNSGKTALLEAIELLSSPGYRHQRLWAPLLRRGETFPGDEDRTRHRVEFNVAHLFHGHVIDVGAWFEIAAAGDGGVESLQARIVAHDGKSDPNLFSEEGIDEEDIQPWHLGLQVTSSRPKRIVVLPLSARGGLRPDAVRASYHRPTPEEDARDVTFITTDSLSASAASAYWKSIALTHEEDLVIRALRVLDDNIERVAFVGVPRFTGEHVHGGLLVKYRGTDQPLPIGSLGEGMWRMFCISIALIRARGGVLLIDEIDTGLHYTAMEKMWWLVLQTAERLNSQVFATSHSSDCINSLASICRAARPEQVGMQRIEQGNPLAVAYTGEEIWTAAQHGIETR